MSGILSAVLKRGISTTIPRMNAAGSASTWRRVSLMAVLPSVAAMSALVFYEMQKHHGCEKHNRPPFVKYEYLRMRNKRFPWGDGNHSLFHNPELNALPDGYEDELEE